jgi:hypothetical protein
MRALSAALGRGPFGQSERDSPATFKTQSSRIGRPAGTLRDTWEDNSMGNTDRHASAIKAGAARPP